MDAMIEAETSSLSQESKLEQALEDYIARQVRGVLTEKEVIEYQELLAQRSRMMRPRAYRLHRGVKMNRRSFA